MPRGTFLFCTFLALVCWPCGASTITYTDPAAWLAASTGVTTITFEGLAPSGGFTDYSTSSGLTQSGVQFVGMNGLGYSLQVVDANFVSPYFNFNSGAMLRGPQYNSTNPPLSYVHVVLPTGVT